MVAARIQSLTLNGYYPSLASKSTSAGHGVRPDPFPKPLPRCGLQAPQKPGMGFGDHQAYGPHFCGVLGTMFYTDLCQKEDDSPPRAGRCLPKTAWSTWGPVGQVEPPSLLRALKRNFRNAAARGLCWSVGCMGDGSGEAEKGRRVHTVQYLGFQRREF